MSENPPRRGERFGGERAGSFGRDRADRPGRDERRDGGIGTGDDVGLREPNDGVVEKE